MGRDRLSGPGLRSAVMSRISHPDWPNSMCCPLRQRQVGILWQIGSGCMGGAKRIRTAGLLSAIQALYHLSYSPEIRYIQRYIRAIGSRVTNK